MEKALFFANAPGAANALIPIIQNIEERVGLTPFVISTDYAKNVLENHNIKIETESSFDAEVQNLRIFVTGTSYPPDMEIKLWNEAKKLNLPSLAVLDQWLNYRQRFVDLKGDVCLPTGIAVMDNFAKSEMLDLGFPEDLIFSIGYPYLENLGVGFHSNNKSKVKKILFVSEPRREDIDLGYHEVEIFEHVLKALKKNFCDFRIELVIKLHPRNDPKDFQGIIGSSEGLNIEIASPRASGRQLIKEMDVVVGMSSMLLLEAVLMEKPVVSVQIGLNQVDPFMLSRRKVLPSVFTDEALKSHLESAFCGKTAAWKAPPNQFDVLWDWFRIKLQRDLLNKKNI